MTHKIIHIDMDAFYASIEQRDHPELRGNPLVVGGNPHSRGVVATASYEARKYGVRSAMPCSQAHRLCPHAIFVRPRFEAYKEVSQQLHEIFRQYTDLVEPLALDEAYLDVTTNKIYERSATRLAKRILEQINRETDLTASAGVSFNKFFAKLASGWKKPNGLTVIKPEDALSIVETLPVGRFYGVGKATEKKMHALGLLTGKDLQEFGLQNMIIYFGKSGAFFYHLALGQDPRPVNATRVRKSLGKENTFDRNITDIEEIKAELIHLGEGVYEDLQQRKLKGKTITIKIRYDTFKTVTRSKTRHNSFESLSDILETALQLVLTTEAGQLPVRLLGVAVSSFESDEEKLWTLF